MTAFRYLTQSIEIPRLLWWLIVVNMILDLVRWSLMGLAHLSH